MTQLRITPREPAVRAEHVSLANYLTSVLSPEQLARPLLVSFTQWDFAVAAVGEITMTLADMGSQVSVALWSDATPLRDVGWQVHHTIAALGASPTIDQRLKKALHAAGLPASTFIDPPKHWKPKAPIPTITNRSRSQLRTLTYRGAPLGRGILEVPPHADVPVTDDYLWPKRYVERAARSYAYVFDATDAVIRQRNITAVFTYNGRFLHDSAVAAAARSHNLPVLAYDTGGLDTDFDLTIDDTHDWSALQQRMRTMYGNWPQPEADAIGFAWFIDRRDHAEALNAKFTGDQRQGLGIERAPDEVVVTYFSSSGDEIAELDLDWADFFNGQEGALLAVAEACRELGYRLVVRTHPHKRFKPRRDVQDWHAAVAAANPDLHLDEHSPVDSYTLMQQSDIVVTFGSTTGVEAGFAERPVIVLGPCAYDELGCATPVRNKAELMEALRAVTPAKKETAIPYGLMMKRRGFAYRYLTRDGDGIRSLAGTIITEPKELIRHLSHRLKRWEISRLTAGESEVRSG